MTTVTERESAARRGGYAPRQPQVNLLPPEVQQARGLASLQRLLALALVVVLIGCVAAYGLVLLAQGRANSDLAAEQTKTSSLLLEQKKYNEVPTVLAALAQGQAARRLGMATEVQWKPYLTSIAAVLPDGVSIDSYESTGATPMTPATPPTNPLEQSAIGQIKFTLRSSTVPNTAAIVDALNGLAGFGDAWVSDSTVTASTNNTTYYKVAATVQVRSGALANRFAAETGKK